MAKKIEPNLHFEGIRIACVGDSLTYGTTLLNKRAECYPARLQKLLGIDYDVLNLGVEGVTVSSFSAKYWGQPTVKNTIEAYRPDYVLLLLGTNDARLKNWSDEDVFASEYAKLLEYFNGLDFSPRLIAMTPPCSFRKIDSEDIDFDVELLAKIVDLQRSALKQTGTKFIDLYSITKDKEHLFAFDKLHLNSKGANFVAYKAYLCLKDMLQDQIQ